MDAERLISAFSYAENLFQKRNKKSRRFYYNNFHHEIPRNSFSVNNYMQGDFFCSVVAFNYEKRAALYLYFGRNTDEFVTHSVLSLTLKHRAAERIFTV